MRSPALTICTFLLAAAGCDRPPANPPASPRPIDDGTVTGHTWYEISDEPREYKVSFPKSFAMTRRPYFDVGPPAGITGIDVASSEKFDQDGMTHAFMILAGRIGKGGLKAEERTKQALDAMVGQVRLPADTKRSAPATVTWGGRPATETVYQPEASRTRKWSRVVVRQLATDTVGYVGIILHPGDVTLAEENRFWDSFKIVPSTPRK